MFLGRRSTDELQKLVGDEAAFVALFTSLPICAQLDEMQSKLADGEAPVPLQHPSARPTRWARNAERAYCPQ